MANPSDEDPSSQPSFPIDKDGREISTPKKVWWVWKHDLYHKAEDFKKALEKLQPGLRWDIKQREKDGFMEDEFIVITPPGKPATEPSTFVINGQEYTLNPGDVITIDWEVMEAMRQHLSEEDFQSLFGNAEFIDEEDDMPLSVEDIDRISAMIAEKNQGFTPAWKQTITICATIALFALGCVGWWTVALNRSEDRSQANAARLEAKLDAQSESLETKLDAQSEEIKKLGLSMNTIGTYLRTKEGQKTSTSTDTD